MCQLSGFGPEALQLPLDLLGQHVVVANSAANSYRNSTQLQSIKRCNQPQYVKDLWEAFNLIIPII